MSERQQVRVPTGRNDTVLLLTEPSLPYEGDVFVDFEVHLDAPGLTARTWVRTIRGDGLDAFVALLDADFRGWEGVRHWRSLEGDLRVAAEHLGHHVRLAFTIAGDRDDDSWTVGIRVSVLPGEELRRLAVDVRDFFRGALQQR